MVKATIRSRSGWIISLCSRFGTLGPAAAQPEALDNQCPHRVRTDKTHSEHNESAFEVIATKRGAWQWDVEASCQAVIQASKPEPRIMRYELTDHEWTVIKPMLPNKPSGVPRVNDRHVLNGIFLSCDLVHRGAICRRSSALIPLATIASFAGVGLACGAVSWTH
jgi:hypothetical protein